MEQKLKLELIRKLLKKDGGEGFSLIELVVVVAVLAILAAIGLPNIINLLNEAIFSATKMSLRQCYSECVTDPDSPPAGPPIPGVVFAATDCSSEMTATINGQTENFPCVISLHMSTGVKSNWSNSYKDCVAQAVLNREEEQEREPICTAVGPGMCGNPPCEDPMWDGHSCRLFLKKDCKAIGGCDGLPSVDCESLSNRLPAQLLKMRYPQCTSGI